MADNKKNGNLWIKTWGTVLGVAATILIGWGIFKADTKHAIEDINKNINRIEILELVRHKHDTRISLLEKGQNDMAVNMLKIEKFMSEMLKLMQVKNGRRN